MPIFEYRCKKCGKLFEELVTGGSNKVICPDCGSAGVEKEFSLFASSASRCSTSGGFG